MNHCQGPVTPPAYAGKAGYGVATPKRLRREGGKLNSLRSEGGFTLVEVLVALVVVVAAMSLLSQGFATGARASSSSQWTTRAAMVGQRVITDLETGELSLSQSQSGSYFDEPDFKYETKSENYEVGTTKVTVTVRWEERSQERKLVLVRLMRERTTSR